MVTENTELYVFENLREASSSTINIGKEISLEVAEPSTHKNAPSLIPNIDFDTIGKRASAFGARFKAMAPPQ